VSRRLSYVILAVAGIAVSSLTLSGCASASSSHSATTAAAGCAGVELVINYHLLEGGDVDQCVPVTGTTTVAEVLKQAQVSTEGTVQYGDQVVCRVNGLPAAGEPFTVEGHDPYTETCQTMAPEYAYWALWVKGAQLAAWDYAQSGVSTEQVGPGDAVGLVFSTGGAAPQPTPVSATSVPVEK